MLASNWTARLAQIVGDQRAAQIRASSWWPTLAATIDHALARGWTLEGLLAGPSLDGSDVDPCPGLLWRISVRTDPPPAPEDLEPEDLEPEDLAPEHSGPWPGVDDTGQDLRTGADLPDDLPGDRPAAPGWLDDLEAAPHLVDATDIITADVTNTGVVGQDVVTGSAPGKLSDQRGADAGDVEATLLFAALSRGGIAALEATDAQVGRQVEIAWEQDDSPVALTRLAEVNAAALGYYQAQLAGSWASIYLTGRLGQDLTGHPHLRPGYAPPGWTSLVTHLRRHGVVGPDTPLARQDQHGTIAARIDALTARVNADRDQDNTDSHPRSGAAQQRWDDGPAAHQQAPTRHQ